MYIANNVGVIEYDGSEWRHISANGALVRCLDVDEQGRVWVGGQDELGYLAADSADNLKYFSLIGLLPDYLKPIGLVRQVYATPRGVYFSSNNLIVMVNGCTVRTWKPKTIFHRTYCVNGEIYTSQREYGLCCINGDSVVLVPGGDFFRDKPIYAMLPYSSGAVLVGTQSDGFFLLNRDRADVGLSPLKQPVVSRFVTDDDPFFQKNWVYSGLRLPGGQFAIGTYRGGLVVFDGNGRITRKVNQDSGLQDDAVWYLFQDNQDNLWMALNNGISYTSINSQLTYFDKTSGLRGTVQAVERYKGDLYVTTNVGLFRMRNGYFDQIGGVVDLCWDVAVFKSSDEKQSLLVASSAGIFTLNGNKAEQIEGANKITYKFLASRVYPNVVYAGLKDGVGVLLSVKGCWKYLGKFEETSGEVYALAEEEDGTLWYSDRYKGVRSCNVVNPYQLVLENVKLHSLPYSPKYDDISLSVIDGVVKIGTEKGLSRYHHQSQQFVTDSSLGVEFANGQTGIRIFTQDYSQNLWFEAFRIIPNRWIERAQKYPNGTYRRIPAQFRTIPEMLFFDVFAEPDNVIWIAGADGLFRYNGAIGMGNASAIRVLIRQVTANRSNVIFNGAHTPEKSDGDYRQTGQYQGSGVVKSLIYSNNSLTFYYASPYFGQNQHVLFSYCLDGYDKGWSDWAYDQKKEYTNLPFGSYTFRVKARNILGYESPIAIYSFRISPPWYRTWGAYIGALLVLILLVWVLVNVNTRLLKISNARLQKLVEERTRELTEFQNEIVEKNTELQHQKEELQAQRDELHEQNRQIHASIQYAKTIQQAILPDLGTFSRSFEHFLIFRPKDVVSGDFYWVSQFGTRGKKSEKIFLAVVDCTGHGVPGAFMSLIGSRLLNEIVNERKIHNPAAILTELTMAVNQALRQDVSDSFDGMDVALCMIERKAADQFVLTFSGANRPLYYLQKGSLKVQTLRGNRKTIGSVLPAVESEFTNWKVFLRPGDMIFMNTDGLVDQNNEFKKKFTACRFHTYITGNAHKPMRDIGRFLEAGFDQFKANVSQRDDITVLGIRLLEGDQE